MSLKLLAVLALGCFFCGVCFGQAPGSDRLIQFYQWRVTRDAQEYTSYDHLGSAYLQKARETGNPVYYGLSEGAYAQALSRLGKDEPEAAGPTAHLAALYLSEHRFSESAELAQKALALEPSLLAAYATLGDAHLEMGEYDEAAIAYGKLKVPAGSMPPRPSLAYLSETRQASLEYILGKPRDAVLHMQGAIAQAREANLARENIAWSQFSLGEFYFGFGDYSKAEAAYEAALGTYPRYHRALAWLGQLRAAQGRYPEAVELYREAIAIIPLPVYAAALGDVYSRLGRADEATKQYNLVNFIVHLGARNQNLFRRELATFYADHDVRLAEALECAQAELAVRKDVYTWDALAWAYFKNGKTEEAAGAVVRALAHGTQDSMLFFHAGMIYDRLGDAAKSRVYLERALALNPHFHVFFADLARSKLQTPSSGRVAAADPRTPDVQP